VSKAQGNYKQEVNVKRYGYLFHDSGIGKIN
jgi:hypothetical protein